jgi:hypothetical protein
MRRDVRAGPGAFVKKPRLPRFSVISLLAAMALASAYTVVNLLAVGPWFERRAGFPFTWYVRSDFGAPSFDRYSWLAVLANAGIGATTISAIALGLEWLLGRFMKAPAGRDNSTLPADPRAQSDAAIERDGSDDEQE